MHFLIILAVLQILAIIVVVALCVAARRADERTERMLTRDEIAERRQTSGVPGLPYRTPLSTPLNSQSKTPTWLAAGRWLARVFGYGSSGGTRG
jgi:hypothetical protein